MFLRIRASENVFLKSISVPTTILQVNSTSSKYLYDLVQATLSISNGSESECKLDNEICATGEQDHLKICLKPPYQMVQQDGWTKLVVTLSGQVYYNYRRNYSQTDRVNLNLNEDVFPANMFNRVVTNYGEFTTLGNFLQVEVTRPEGVGLGLACGFIEMLEVEAVWYT